MTSARNFLPAFLLFFLLQSLYSQAIPTVAAYSLTSVDTPGTIVKTVNDLIFSFIREQRNYRIIDLRSEIPREDLSIPEGSDYIFYGKLGTRSDGIKLELVLKGGVHQTTRIISRVYENSNRILLESRLLVRDLFDQSISLPDPPFLSLSDPDIDPGTKVKSENIASQPTLILQKVADVDSLSGSWHGESGIEKILILRGGRGVAVFASGVSITLELISGQSELIIRQKGASNMRQFMDLPDSVARQAVSVVPPLEWRFLVNSDLTRLVGKSSKVSVLHDGKNILSMEKVESNIEWIRD